MPPWGEWGGRVVVCTCGEACSLCGLGAVLTVCSDTWCNPLALGGGSVHGMSFVVVKVQVYKHASILARHAKLYNIK